MQCRSVLLRLDEFRTGELEREEASTIEQHLEGCSWCEDSYEELESIAVSARELSTAPPESCSERVRSAVADRHDLVKTVRGTFHVAFSERGITMIGRTTQSDSQFAQSYATRYGKELIAGKIPEKYRAQIAAAAEGHGPAHPKVDLSELPEFEREVLGWLLEIPAGEVRPYAWVARQVGRPRAARAIGNVCANNPVPLVVPCHRVVPSEGGVGNYGFGTEMKRELLEREGVAVDEIEEMKRKGARYVGSRTTRIYCYPTCPDARRIREENRVLLRNERDAKTKGFRSCLRCQPLQLSA